MRTASGWWCATAGAWAEGDDRLLGRARCGRRASTTGVSMVKPASVSGSARGCWRRTRRSPKVNAVQALDAVCIPYETAQMPPVSPIVSGPQALGAVSTV